MKNILSTMAVITLAALLMASCGQGTNANGSDQDSTEIVKNSDIVFAVDSINNMVAEGRGSEIGQPVKSFAYDGSELTIELYGEKNTINGMKQWLGAMVVNDFHVYGNRLLKAVVEAQTPVVVKYINHEDESEVLHTLTITPEQMSSHWKEVQ